jgi:hypothetical protein
MTPAVNVTKLDNSTFEVAVQGRTPTTHIVTVAQDYAARLIERNVPIECLVLCSFEFLLEREPNTSILRHFDLTVISSYFPEYERVIRGML